MTNETQTPRGDAQARPQGLSAADRPTAAVRSAVERLLRVERTIGGIDFDAVSLDQYEHDRWLAVEAEGRAAHAALAAALAALDARLKRLTRFVRAYEALEALRNSSIAEPGYGNAVQAFQAARAAVTEEDLA